MHPNLDRPSRRQVATSGHAACMPPRSLGRGWAARAWLALGLLNGVIAAQLGTGIGRVPEQQVILPLPASRQVLVIVDTGDTSLCRTIVPAPASSCESWAPHRQVLHIRIWVPMRMLPGLVPLASATVALRQLAVLPGSSALLLFALLLGMQRRPGPAWGIVT